MRSGISYRGEGLSTALDVLFAHFANMEKGRSRGLSAIMHLKRRAYIADGQDPSARC